MSKKDKKKQNILSFPHFVISEIGRRSYQEDTYDLKILPNRGLLAGIYDGHCGGTASEVAKSLLLKTTLLKLKKVIEPGLAFKEAYEEVEKVLSQEHSGTLAGTTAITFYLKDNLVYHAHAGDSRLLIVSRDGVRQLTADHRLTNKEEAERVYENGGNLGGDYVINEHGHGLMPTRTLGDFDFKDVGVISTPETAEYQITSSDKWLLAGTDGLFDEMTNEEVGRLLLSYKNTKAAALALKREVLVERRGEDNLTFILIKFN